MAALPEPAAEQKTHSQKLQQKMIEAIRDSDGSIGFDRYMAMALYQPGLGYYAAGAQKFGAAGDFITSPEVSPLFAQCLARQIQQAMVALPDAVVIEFGAGSGALATDLLLALESSGSLPQAYWIVEVSAELQQRQQQRLKQKCAQLLDRVVWLQQLPDESVNAVVIANEVLDAMPVRAFEKQNGELFERKVSENKHELSWLNMPADESLKAALKEIEASTEQPLPENYRSEFNPSLKPWLSSVAAMLKNGLVLLIDYGYDASEYYSAEREMGTMMCYYRHRAHDNVFFYPGLQDITAFVDFTALAESAFDCGFEVMGYTTQAQFLFGCGLAEIFENKMAQLSADSVKQQLHLSQQVKTLTLPGEMGERFKVMALGKNCQTDETGQGLMGFTVADLRRRL
ncbi:MAG: SAM-dependent methyltransferase [Gammaproteobacteria bacterium]|nr:SAM-dependent methyltransferase [Gammaproteobacteria bacterium]